MAALALPTSPAPGTLFLTSAQGQVKRLAIEDLPGIGLAPATVMRLDDNDWLVSVNWVQEEDEVILGTAEGQGIRFVVNEVRTMGARAGGVIGIRLEEEDVVVGATVVRPWVKFATITDTGVAKRTELAEFSSQRRGGKGIQIAKLERGERVMGVGMLLTASYFIPITQRGAAKTVTGRSVPEQGRATHGDSIIALQGRDLVAAVVVPQERLPEMEEA
jgi:DNA gyrase subunit A